MAELYYGVKFDRPVIPERHFIGSGESFDIVTLFDKNDKVS